jgi:hypothetical protein
VTSTLGPDAERLLTAFRETVSREQDMVSHRMTWLMTLNGFIVAGIVVVLGIRELVPPDKEVTPSYVGLVVALLSIAGFFANCSTFFSNYWAERAVDGAGRVLEAELGLLETGHATLDSHARTLLRLYGRDPLDGAKRAVATPPRGKLTTLCERRDPEDVSAILSDPRNDSLRPLGSIFFGDPKSTPLHSWFFLPSMFALVFLVAPFAIRPDDSGVWEWRSLFIALVYAVPSLAATLAILSDRRERAQRRERALAEESNQAAEGGASANPN